MPLERGTENPGVPSSALGPGTSRSGDGTDAVAFAAQDGGVHLCVWFDRGSLLEETDLPSKVRKRGWGPAFQCQSVSLEDSAGCELPRRLVDLSGYRPIDSPTRKRPTRAPRWCSR